MFQLFRILLEIFDANFDYLNLRSLFVEIRKNEIRKRRSASNLGRSFGMVLGAVVDALHSCNGRNSVDEAERKLDRTIKSFFRTKGTTKNRQKDQNNEIILLNFQFKIPRHVFK